MRVKRFLGAGLVLVAITMGLAACGGDEEDEDEGRALSGTTIELHTDPKPHYDPDVVKAPPGAEVLFNLKNEGDKVLNFTISFLGVDQDVEPNQLVQVRFRVEQPPKGLDYYTFYDKNHQGEGMQGRLNVTTD